MASSKPTLIFVPGGWHTPECFSPVTEILSKAGYKISSVAHPSIGTELRGEAPLQSWDEDVAAIRETVLQHLRDGEEVVLVVHSYGGTVGSEAVKGLNKKDWESSGNIGGVVRLVYLAAFALPLGSYLWESTGGKPFSPRIRVDGDLSYATDTYNWFYNECSAETAASLDKTLQSQCWKTCLSKVTYRAWYDIPSTYLLCEKDAAVPLAMQEGMVNSADGCFEIERCDADHSPFQSRPEKTAEVIRRAAGEAI